MEKKSAANFTIASVTALVLLLVFASFLGGGMNVYQPHPLYLFVGGLIAISAMVLPGVSGSFMLLILGLYTYVIGLVSQLVHGSFAVGDIVNLLFLVAGFGVGFLTTVRLLKVAFAKYRDKLMAVLLGLLISSWYVLWPFVKVNEVVNDEPVVAKISPVEYGLTSSFMIVVAIGVIAFLVGKLQFLIDKKQKPVDDGFDRL
jgi:putative membrane protein